MLNKMESDQKQLVEKESYLFKLTNLNYETWAPNAMKHLLVYPDTWEWIKNGVEPAFITPPLEIPREEQPRQNQRGARALRNEGGRGLGGRRGRGRGRGFLELAEEDEENDQDQDREDPEPERQPVMIRNPLFLGIGGLEEWKETLRANKRRKERHERDIWRGPLF